MDVGNVTPITCAMPRHAYWSALADSEAVLGEARVHVHGFFVGCLCHRHIWMSEASDAAKRKLIEQSLPESFCKKCWRAGRNVSALARGV